ncbi:FecR family protein [Paraflavitalea pollutisoli]|uniref:FecR family protein n=1 Tax=Paraflavitalea pollutisoli TaxID=3034143 RepID=UPI0023EC35DD|nr:FecR family protein [Paraflavitalea sp. H1-2-19X]
MDHQRLNYLLEEYILGRLDKIQAAELLSLLDEQSNANQLDALIDQQLADKTYDQEVDLPLTRQRILDNLAAAMAGAPTPTKAPVHHLSILRRWRWAAAAILLLVAAGTFWLLLPGKRDSAAPGDMAVQDIDPGHEGARLKLSDNRIILVDSVKDGLIAMDGQVAIYKENGNILYKGANDAVIYNEMVTDKGRQYAAVLPDGSTVRLNAMSSLRYPLQFTGKERAVTLTGEAIFQVKHEASMPFRVYIHKAGTEAGMVEDLGTEFNINAYNDEQLILTSVSEGSVAVRTAAAKTDNTVKAGQQAQIDAQVVKVVNDADIDQAMAWSKGIFSFNGETLQGVMRQLARWYDVDVVYEGQPGKMLFAGEIAMNQTLSQVLKGLESMKIKFRIEHKRIVVMP